MSRGAVFRWGAMIVGVVCVYQSVKSWWLYEPLDDEPESITVTQAAGYTYQSDVRYVSLVAELDSDRRMYRTGIAKPYYSVIPPDTMIDLNAPDAPNIAQFDEYLGCLVTVSAPLDPTATGVMQVIETDQGESMDEGDVRSEKYIAPVIGTDNRLFALSPLFYNSDQGTQWSVQGTYTGRLSRLSDIESNAHGVNYGPSAIADHLRQWGAPVSVYDSYVILTEHSEPNTSGSFIAPVVGSDNSVFVEATPEREREMASTGVITGIFKPHDASAYGELGGALGGYMPDRIAIIRDQSAAQYNAGRQAMFGFGLTAGIFMFCFGAGTTWLLHIIKKSNKRRMQEMFRPDSASQDEWSMAA